MTRYDPRGSANRTERFRTRQTSSIRRGIRAIVLGLAAAGTFWTGSASGQTSVEEARDWMARGDPQRAIELLDQATETDPTADAWLYLGIAYASAQDRERALEVFAEGSELYPSDSRFHDETAGVHLANRDVELAMAALERAIEIDPGDAYGSDLLASIYLSEGDVREALAIWNAVGQPEIDRISQNFAPGILDRTVPRALAFDPGDTLRFPDWKTTQARLIQSRLYSNVGIELEPSAVEERFNAIVQTSSRGNSRGDILLDLVRGLPVETTYLDWWNIGGSGISWRSNFRWDKDRRRLVGQIFIPLPLPGLPLVEISDVWRWEDWNLERPIREDFSSQAQFDYKVNMLGLRIETTPHYRLELHGGFEYRNRDVTGTIDALGMDERNSATISAGTIIRTVDRRYKNQLHLDGFVARKSLLGDFDFSGGTAAILNRFVIREERQTYLDVGVSGGTLGGNAPIDHYFILGLGSVTDHDLRAHVASDGGRYGQAPMGTDFVLVNTDIEHRLTTVPLFNTLSIPYIQVKALGFFDAGKTFDRQRIFRQDQWFKDVGAGIKFETPTYSFTILYGRDLAGHDNSLYAYTERNFW